MLFQVSHQEGGNEVGVIVRVVHSGDGIVKDMLTEEEITLCQ